MLDQLVIATFYRFVPLNDLASLRMETLDSATAHGIKGSILLAPEGINGTVAGQRSAMDAFFAEMGRDGRFADLEIKESYCEAAPFKRMKVRLKREIVTFRQPVSPLDRVGTYVKPEDWNDVIADPRVLVIDTRNKEEVELGTFVNAVNPGTESFTEFADYVDGLNPDRYDRVAMFCTGGIRCEKASSYMLDQGFPEVMHLQGGILKYLETVPPEETLWKGECFVFDERVTVDHDLKPGSYTLCRGCRRAVAAEERNDARYEEGVSCAQCAHGLTDERRERLRERHRQVLLAEVRGEQHIARRS